MSPLWIAVIGLWCSAVLALTGCNPLDPAASARDPEDVFAAKSMTVAPNAVPPLRVVNGVNGDVVIIAARGDKDAANAVKTGTDGGVEQARIEAQEHMSLTVDLSQVQIQPQVDKRGQSMNAADRAFLHLRVLPGTSLPEVRARTGNIGIYGAVGDVTAVISNSGSIEVLGGGGNVDLLTANGSIQVDLEPGKSIAAHASKGNIDVIAEEAVVSARTTEGNVRFIGTLRGGQTHYFTTTAAGGVEVALPPYPDRYPTPQVYRYYVTTASTRPVNVEYPARDVDNAALPICGFIHSNGPYDYHVENTEARTGRIEVTPVVTGTYYFTGTLATKYFRFDTDQTRVAFYTPLPQTIHIYTAVQLNHNINIAGNESIAPECAAALEGDSGSAIVLRIKTERGPVYIHQMLTGE